METNLPFSLHCHLVTFAERARITSIAVLLLMLLPASNQAQRLPLRAYTVADGLPNNLTNKIVRDSRGFLWFCTGDGLSRFDGYTFTNFSTDQGLPHRNITDFLETRSGEFWIGTNAGLVRFDPKGTPSNRVVDVNNAGAGAMPMFSVLMAPDTDRQASVVNVLLEGNDGTIWCGTAKHLYRLERNPHFKLVRVELGNSSHDIHVLDLLQDRNGLLWVASFGWLCRRWPDGDTACYTSQDGLPDVNFHDLFEDHLGRLWVATRLHGFFQFAADQTHMRPTVVRAYAGRDGPGAEWVNQVFETSDRRFWVATNKGVAEFFPDAADKQTRFKNYDQTNGLLYYTINTINEDRGGNLWLGSDVGAMKFARQGFFTYDEQQRLLIVAGIFGSRTGYPCFRASLLADAQDNVFGSAKADLSHPARNLYSRYGCFDGERFTWLKPDVLENDQLGWVGEMVSLQRRNGEWWLGTGEGVYRFPPLDDFARLKNALPIAVYSTRDGLTAPQTFRLFEDSSGNIWVSCIQPNGIARWDTRTERWEDLTNAPNMPSPLDNLARSFGEDSKGNVWIGLDTGAARYRDGRLTVFNVARGLPQGAIQNIYLDRAGRLWLVSSRSGLIRVDNPNSDRPTFKSYTTAEGLSSNAAEGITEDLYGHIYVGTGRGLDRLDPATSRFKRYTTADGLAPGKVIAGYRDATGQLWFGTLKGLSRFVPSNDEVVAAPPPVVITEINVAGEGRNVSAIGETEVGLNDMASDRSHLRIGFVGLSFVSGEVLRYQFMLEGADHDWSTPTEQRSITYARVAPGSYRFLVRAVNSDGLVSPQPAIITFRIVPPIWQRWWFVGLISVVVIAIVYLLYRYRVARVVELANVRTRIATDLHDDIGTNLTKIAILSEVVKQHRGNGGNADEDALSSIARISRESVAAMSDIVWAINPHRDSFRDLVRRMRQHAEEVCLAQEIDLQFDVDPNDSDLKLNVDVRRDLYLIFKETMNNAIRHSGCNMLQIEITESNGMVGLAIRDNGKGFDPHLAAGGNGLMSMRRRAQSHKGTIQVNSREGETYVEIRLPCRSNRGVLPTQKRR